MHQAITIEWLIWETRYVPHHMPTLNASCWWDVWLCLFNNHKAVDLLFRRQQGTSWPPKIQTMAICYWTWPPLHKIVFAQSPGTSRTKNRQHNWRPKGRVSREREKTMRICEEREQGEDDIVQFLSRGLKSLKGLQGTQELCLNLWYSHPYCKTLPLDLF